jgi:DNA gyrase/topoisomerase IV subunit A
MQEVLTYGHRHHEFEVGTTTTTPSVAPPARVVGEVLGKYHPHGNMAVNDALVRMATNISPLYPLVDGHVNFGSIDNDPAAAMRYTECRLTHLATQTLLQELADDTVYFIAKVDGNKTRYQFQKVQSLISIVEGFLLALVRTALIDDRVQDKKRKERECHAIMMTPKRTCRCSLL